MTSVLPFVPPLPPERCANCIGFNLRKSSPTGFCDKLEEDVNRDYWCERHARSIRPEPWPNNERLSHRIV